jgi:hypothetical protein
LSRQPLLALLGIGTLLALLALAGWGTARAAPTSAGAPQLSIVSSSGSTLTLEFDLWSFNQPLLLSYTQGTNCSAGTPLPAPDFEVTSAHFQHDYPLPSGIPQGSYHLCASDALDGLVISANEIFITTTGTVELTPPVPTPTPTNPGAGGSPTPPLTNTPGNQGASASGSNTNGNNGSNTLAAIIVLCLLVLALLAYLVSIWLRQGKRASANNKQPTRGPQPPGGGQAAP